MIEKGPPSMTDDEMMTAEQWAQRNARPIRSPRAAQAGREAADKAVIDPQQLAEQGQRLITTTIDQMETQFTEGGETP